MAVSKRLRYEVLRRDAHTCRYCGASAPDVPLRVDHVTPVALGGTDDPSNLVTACEPCNSGKTSSTPDAAMVAGVSRDAMRWSVAWKRAAEEQRLGSDQRAKDTAKIKQAFTRSYKARYGTNPDIPEDAAGAIGRWIELGLPQTKMLEMVAYTVGRDTIPQHTKWRYFAGCCWNALKEIEQRARVILAEPEDDQDPNEPELDDDDDLVHIRAAALFSRGWSPGVVGFRHLYLAVESAIFEQFEREDIIRAAELCGPFHEPDITLFLGPPDDGALSLPDEQKGQIKSCARLWRETCTQERPDEPPTDVDANRIYYSLIAAFGRGYELDRIRDATKLAGQYANPNVTHFLPLWSPRLERVRLAREGV